ncbi:hypothetical protein T440DRAFT_523512 [Plenodomus tracheiphilus IPT5]|uniref:Helicase ATP-binding domain-containing protein n=1 Tax=Plenodomus tracheiphilus IPT5 TaxID=1408161 RepID=A0A6A7AML2_9PLEO|nr:hypothetical protein T440DRAFT_523512 [Plenodomus tracheiphilus IPT5]
MQHSLRLLVVMATDMGKSMLFMLPASVSPGSVTIIKAPLNLLQDDLRDRCDQLSMPIAKWYGRRLPYWARIVFTTPEGAATKSFGRFLDEKRMLRQLDLVVIDECHILLESSETWRLDVLRLSEMTAFLEVAGLDRKELDIVRDKSMTQPNIAYQVLEYTRGELDTTFVNLLAAKRVKYGLQAQILVYCPSVEETKRLGRLPQYTAYYRQVASDEEKARMVRAFIAGAEKLCTATTILGLGIHAKVAWQGGRDWPVRPSYCGHAEDKRRRGGRRWAIVWSNEQRTIWMKLCVGVLSSAGIWTAVKVDSTVS